MGEYEKVFENQYPERALEWALRQAGPGSRLISAARLKGGISSEVYRLDIDSGDGSESISWVMRLIQDKEWLQNEPKLAIHEKEALQAACSAGMPAPVWIASDPDGRECGCPAVLMTCLPGSVILEEQADPTWLAALGAALARLHGAGESEIPWQYFTYASVESLRLPDWTSERSAWRKIIDTIQGPRPAYTPRLIHRDYHPANVLWKHGEISGIVDWINACQGPAGIDTGHCRLNLVELYGVTTADRFLEAYLESAGASMSAADPYWDMLCLIEMLPGPPGVYKGWEELGLKGLTPGLVTDRLDEYAVHLAAKI